MFELPPNRRAQQQQQARPEGRFARGFNQRAGAGLGQQAADAARNFYSPGPRSTQVSVGEGRYYQKPPEGGGQPYVSWIGPDGQTHYGTSESRDTWQAKYTRDAAPAPVTPGASPAAPAFAPEPSPVTPATPAPAPTPTPAPSAPDDGGLVRIGQPAMRNYPGPSVTAGAQTTYPDDGGLHATPPAPAATPPAPAPAPAPATTGWVGTPPGTPPVPTSGWVGTAAPAVRPRARPMASDETLKTDVTPVAPADVDGFLAAMSKRKGS